LSYYEWGEDATAATGSRKKKIDLVNDFKAAWRELFDDL
jgi:hypothetical protein